MRVRARSGVFIAVVALVVAAVGGTDRLYGESGSTVTIDAATAHQTIDGFGSSERVFDDPHVFNNFDPLTGRSATVLTDAQQEDLLDRLYGDLGLTRVRPASPDTAPGSGIEPVNDNADPNVMDPAQFNFGWKNLDDHCLYIDRARGRGVSTFFLSPLNRESWMGVTTEGDAAEYAEWLLAQVSRCAELGVELPYLSVANEPSYNRNTMTGSFTRDVVKVLGPRLRAAGFDTMIVLADDLNPVATAGVATAVLADEEARGYVGALATHIYGGNDLSVLRTMSEQYDIPLWMTEAYQKDGLAWAETVHKLLADYNVSAVDYLWGFFGQHKDKQGSQLISLNHNGAEYTGYTLQKRYYMMGQYSRFVRGGMRRIDVVSSDRNIRVSAYWDDEDDELVVVAINSAKSAKEVSFGLQGLDGVGELTPVRTSASENWAELPPVTVSGSSFSSLLPPKSVTTFVGVVPEPPPTTTTTVPEPTTTTVPEPTTTTVPEPTTTTVPEPTTTTAPA